jgi:[ribosomal protein S5]-alanine N-acetyltransferase
MIYEINDNYYVRGLQESDLEGEYPKWFENQDVCKYNSHGKFIKTKEYFEEFYNSLNNESQLVWAICHKNDRHIGNISLQNISYINRNAEFAILIGNAEHWGKNISFLTSNVLINHGFEKLNLEKVYCGIAGTNKRMINLAERLGMKQEGCRRNQLYLEGKWVDMLEFGLLREEFYKINL